jgi:hypothetical protein
VIKGERKNEREQEIPVEFSFAQDMETVKERKGDGEERRGEERRHVE